MPIAAKATDNFGSNLVALPPESYVAIRRIPE